MQADNSDGVCIFDLDVLRPVGRPGVQDDPRPDPRHDMIHEP